MRATFFDTSIPKEMLWFPDGADGDQRMLYESVRQFCEQGMAPYEADLENGDYVTARALFQQCAALGFFGAEIDEADGGMGLGVVETTLLAEALGRGHSLNVGLMVHQGVGMLPVACFGTDEQRNHYLPGAIAGDRIMAFALTEPHCGSDALALATSAVPEGDGYVINGSKQFITNAAYADCFITFARVPDAGITTFLIDADAPGVSVGSEEHKLGQRASSTCSVNFENVRVDSGKVLGKPGDGHRIALNMLNLGRLKLAAACVGKMKVLLPQAVAYLRERTAFGQTIGNFGMLRDRLARMGASCYASESTVYRVASIMEHARRKASGEDGRLTSADRLAVLQDFALECALVKSYVTEALGTFTDDLLQLFGGYGFSEEYPAAKAFRDARVTRLYEGTTEICRLTAVRRLCALAAVARFGELESRHPSLWPVWRAKSALGMELNAHVHEVTNDMAWILTRQELTGDFGTAFEQIYAIESAWLRCHAAGAADPYAAALARGAQTLAWPVIASLPYAHWVVGGPNFPGWAAAWPKPSFGDKGMRNAELANYIMDADGKLPGSL